MSINLRNSCGFTLAEVMIVLTVIGVLTAILLPVARQSMPDENLMKFKKAHNTLGTVIRELVTSDKYYRDGDLGVKPNSSLVDSATYFCETIADVLNVKSLNCSSFERYSYSYVRRDWDSYDDTLDVKCKQIHSFVGNEIILPDGTIFYQGSPAQHFGYIGVRKDISGDATDDNFSSEAAKTSRLFNGTVGVNANKFDDMYKVFCIDIDGLNSGEDPFGYGIRADGKILTGKRADEWLEREVNEE